MIMSIENKKVIGAQETTVNSIKFKSLLESRFYNYLRSIDIDFDYEVERITLMEGFKPRCLFYKAEKSSIKQDNNKVRGITYTPDFVIRLNGYTVYVEAKGFKTDSYNIKVKLFRKHIDNWEKVIFAEVKTLKQLKELIETVKEL